MLKGFNLKKYNPKTYITNGDEFYFDKDRKFLVAKTEKEAVRQKMIEYLHNELYVPYNAIRTDVAMYNFEKKAKGRADILITAFAEDGYDIPIMLVRCGESNKAVSGKIKTEALKQLEQTGAVCAIVTNGIDLDFYVNENETPVLKNEIINYPFLCDMLNIEGYDYESENDEPLQREAYSYFISDAAIKNGITYGILGEDTKKELIPALLLLNDCLMYEDEKLTALKGNGFELISDEGLRFSKVDNGFNGNYRLFLVKAGKEIKTVSVAILSSDNGRDCTYLATACDSLNGVKAECSLKLKLVLDDIAGYDSTTSTIDIKGIKVKTNKILSINDAEVKSLLAYAIENSIK